MTSEVLPFTVQWELVSRLSPGKAMAMAMDPSGAAMATAMGGTRQSWQREGGGDGD
jgi:hypothetical protein